MSAHLALRLAMLDGAGPEAVEAAIALWPLPSRVTLAALGVIDSAPDVTAERRWEPSDFELTENGIRAIARCARWKQDWDVPGRDAER